MMRRLVRKRRGDSSDAMPLNEEHHVNVHDMTHQQPRFKHVSMGSELAVGAGFNQNENAAAVQQPDVDDNGCNDDSPVLNSIRVQVVLPEKPSRSGTNAQRHERARQEQSSGTTTQEQERARQKLDSLARQHRRHQRQNNSVSRGGYFEIMPLTDATPITLSKGGSTVTADTSDTPIHQQQQLIYNYNSIVHPSLLTRHLDTCVDELANKICNNADQSFLSLESSYYSKHDFHNLPKAASPTEHTDASTLETDIDVTNGKNNGQSEGGNNNDENQNICSAVVAPPRIVRYHDNYYQPTPPLKRSGGTHSTSAWEKRKSSSSQQKQQQTHEDKSEINATLLARPVIDMQVKLVNDKCEHVVVTPSPKRLNSGTTFASPAEDVPSAISSSIPLAVAPSPPTTSLQQQKKSQHRPLLEPQQEQEPQQQLQQRPNTSHMFVRLLKRHQKTKSPSKKVYQKNPNHQKEETKNQPQQSRQQPQRLQQLGKSTRRDPEESADEVIQPAPTRHQPLPTPTKEGKEGEPPEDFPDAQQLRRRVDPPPDPPAEYKHYPSKVIDSFPRQKCSRSLPSPQEPKSSNMQAGSILYPPEGNSTSLQPPSQIKRQIISQQERHQLAMPQSLVKVNSKISNFSSGFFTAQTFNTTSSKFWDEVDDYSETKNATVVKKYTASSNEGKAKETVKKGHSSVGDAANDKQTTAPLHQSAVSDQPNTTNHKTITHAKKPQNKQRTTSLETINDDDSYSNAFSLKLPIDRNGGGFDDSDISALHMNDSATVFFQRQLNKTNVDDDEKDRHQLRRQHQHQHQKGEVQDVEHEGQLELKEINHSNPKASRRASALTPNKLDTPENIECQDGRHQCSSPFDAFSRLFKLDNCDTKQPQQNNLGKKKGWDREVSVHTMKTAAEEMVNFVEQLEERNNSKNSIQDLHSAMRSKVLLPMPLNGSPQDEAIGFVPLDENQHEESNDVALLGQSNKNRSVRSSKSLADDLTVGASRLSHGIASKLSSFTEDGDQSELSEDANRIFQTALKKDIFRSPKKSSETSEPNKSIPVVASAVGRSKSSLADASNFGSNIPSDFVSWFELPSPGLTCIPLLPLLNVSLRNSIDSDVSPLSRVNDTVDLAFASYLSRASQGLAGNECDVKVIKQSMGAIDADGDTGSIRFVNASIHLQGISDAAVFAILRREFQDAAEVYNTLLASCQASTRSKLGLVGQLVASTLHNLSVLHMWNQEYDQALPYIRESLRIKTELVGDDGGSVNLWSSMGLINFAIGSTTSALASFRKAEQIASKFYPEGHLTGKLMNNMACVNFKIGKMPLVQSQFKQSIKLQRSSSDNIELSSENDLFSISIALFNMGVTCARQNQCDAAISHIEACYAIQQAILEDANEIVQNTAYYLDSLRIDSLTSEPKASNNDHGACQPGTASNEIHHVLQNAPQRLKSKPKNSSNDRQENTEQLVATKPVIKQRVLRIDSKPTYLTRSGPNLGQSEQISYPMICLGSLQVEATISERIYHSLEGFPGSLAFQSFGGVRELSLLCRRPAIASKHKTMSQNIIHYGVLTMKKREAQSELHRNLERYGPRHPDVGKSYHNLGLLYLLTEKYNDALSYLENSIRIYTNAMGVKHPDVSSSLMLKGLAQLALERFEDSMASMLRVRRLREDALGQKHPELGQILNNLACVQYELGDYRKAESLFQEALELQREAFTNDSAFLTVVSKVLSNSAFLHAKSGSFPKALIELEGALQIRKDILFEDNSLDDILYNMAHILAIQKLQHGALNLKEITDEYIAMLKTSKIH